MKLLPTCFALGFLILLGSCVSVQEEAQAELEFSVPGNFPAWAGQGGVYEIFIRNFTPEGTFKAASARLESLQTLGIKTLWLMPFHPIGEKLRKGSLGSPYSIKDFYGVDSSAGTLEDVRNFVTKAHGLGYRVIMDLVASHSAWDNPWVAEHPQWYLKDSRGQVRSPGVDWTDVAGFDHRVPELRQALARVMEWWILEVGIDGWRCDVAYRMPRDFWAEVIPQVRRYGPVLFLAEGTEPWLLEAGFDMVYASTGYSHLKSVFEEGVAQEYIQAAFEEWTGLGGSPALRFITNHDETSWSDPPTVLFKSPQGSRAAAVATFLLPGIPLVYNHQELGSMVKANLFEKSLPGAADQEMLGFYGKLLGIWKSHPVFFQGNLAPFSGELPEGVAAYKRRLGVTTVLVVVNFRNSSTPLDLGPGWERSLDLWTGQPAALGELGAYGWKILYKNGDS